jgi:O-antigen ligase
MITKPTGLASTLFLLLFTGPPKFRFRDPGASLSGELDFAAIIQIVVWIIAALWCTLHLFNRTPEGPKSFWHSYRAGIVFIFTLILSIFVSLAPLLTAFKAFQVIVMLMFCYLFTVRFGVTAGLNRLMISNLILCGLIAISAIVAPELILFDSETGAQRLTGRGIAEAGIVGSFAIILLVTLRPKMPKAVLAALTAGLVYFVFLTLMRSAYVVLVIFLVLVVLRLRITRQARHPVTLFVLILGVGIFYASSIDFSYYRDPESIYTLSDRVGLWTYYLEAVTRDAPLLGFGFVSGPRVLGLEYNPRLGSAHSLFFEALVGGGFIGLLAFLLVFFGLAKDAIWLFLKDKSKQSFAASALFLVVAVVGIIGGELDVGQIGFTFWYLVISLPVIRRVSPLGTPL